MIKRRFLRLLLVFSVCSFCFTQSPAQRYDLSMEQLEEKIYKSLQNLDNYSTNLIDELNELRKTQQTSEQKLKDYELSLQSLLNETNSYAQSLQDMKLKLQQKTKTVTKLAITLVILLLLFVGTRVVIIILKFKGISLPYLVNALL